MSAKTGIEWTDATWNPTAGCSIVSPGCTNCYAMKMAHRIGSKPGSKYAGLTKVVNGKAVWTGVMHADEKALDAPLHWRAPKRIFVNSMSDLFHEGVADDFIDRVFAVMALCPQHVFQVLTKRAERMLAYCAGDRSYVVDLAAEYAADWRGDVGGRVVRENLDATGWPLPHVWLGVSVEDQERADERIPLLLETPAAVRFVSAEPLLGPVDLTRITTGGVNLNAFYGSVQDNEDPQYCGHLPGRPRLDWVIAGGESGPKARPMHPEWARSLRDQCRAARVPFFFKQWGEWASAPPAAKWSDFDAWPAHRKVLWSSGDTSLRAGKKAAGALLDGRAWSEWPA